MGVELDPNEFKSRFQLIVQFRDGLDRVHQLTCDQLTGLRVAVRHYQASSEIQKNAVLQNLGLHATIQIYPWLCPLVCYSCIESDIVAAAFAFGFASLDQIIEKKDMMTRIQVCTQLANQMVSSMAAMKNYSLNFVDTLILSNIVLTETGTIQYLYDERAPNLLRPFQQCVESYFTPRKINAIVRGHYESILETEDDISYQLGLIILDLCRCHIRDSIDGHPFYSSASDGFIVQNNHAIQEIVHSLASDENWSCLISIGVRLAQIDANKRVSLAEAAKQLGQLTTRLPSFQLIDLLAESSKTSYTPMQVVLQTAEDQLTVEELQADDSDGAPTELEPSETSGQLSFEKLHEKISQSVSVLSCHESVRMRLEELIQMLKISSRGVVRNYSTGSQYFGEIQMTQHFDSGQTVWGERKGLGIYFDFEGDVYFGQWAADSLSKGIYLFSNGESFEGAIQDSGKEGIGRYRYSSGNVYGGEWKDDLKQGHGIMQYETGEIYKGEWVAGKRHGRGKVTYINGIVYEGNFKGGLRLGNGVMTFPNGAKAYGFWDNKGLQGASRFEFPAGELFEGQCVNSVKMGDGIYYWDNVKAEGAFFNNQLPRKVKISYADGDLFVGQLEEGSKCGIGVYRYSCGDVFSGEWKDDAKIRGIYQMANGATFEGDFINGTISNGKMVYGNGDIFVGSFLDGMRHGTGTYLASRDQGKANQIKGRWEFDQFCGEQKNDHHQIIDQ